MHTFVLDAFAARSCAVKTHNRFDPSVVSATQAADPSLTESFDDGPTHLDRVIDAVLVESRRTGCCRVVDLRGMRDASWHEQEDACRAAMLAGADVVVHGAVPTVRTGTPDTTRSRSSPIGSRSTAGPGGTTPSACRSRRWRLRSRPRPRTPTREP